MRLAGIGWRRWQEPLGGLGAIQVRFVTKGGLMVESPVFEAAAKGPQAAAPKLTGSPLTGLPQTGLPLTYMPIQTFYISKIRAKSDRWSIFQLHMADPDYGNWQDVKLERDQRIVGIYGTRNSQKWIVGLGFVVQSVPPQFFAFD